MRETWVQSLGWEDPSEKERLPTPVFWPGEFHGLRSTGLQSVRHDREFHFHFHGCSLGYDAASKKAGVHPYVLRGKEIPQNCLVKNLTAGEGEVFPCGSMIKNPRADAGDTCLILDPRRYCMPQST